MTALPPQSVEDRMIVSGSGQEYSVPCEKVHAIKMRPRRHEDTKKTHVDLCAQRLSPNLEKTAESLPLVGHQR
jgi:hypothetical protein